MARKRAGKKRGQPAQSPDAALRTAVEAHLAGDTARAESGYRQVLAKNSDSVTALYSLAGVLLGRGEVQEAARLLARASRLAPDDASILNSLAAARRRLGDWAGARTAAEACLTRKPDHPGARYSRALAARRQGEAAVAAADLDRLLAAGRDDPGLNFERGIAALALSDDATALDQLQRAHATQPGDVDVAIYLAMAANRLEQPRIGLAALDAVADAAEGNSDWLAQRGKTLAHLGHRDAAKATLARAVAEGTQDRVAYFSLTELEKADDEFAAAEAHYRQGLAAFGDAPPDSPAATDAARMANNLASILRSHGQIRAAEATLRQGMALAPSLELSEINRLLVLHYDPAETRDSIYQAHRAWQQRHAAALEAAAEPPAPGPADKAPLWVGILGAKLSVGPPLLLYLRGLALMDQRSVRLVVYDLGSTNDQLNQKLRACVSAYYEVGAESSEAIAQRIRQDGIDILINKMGHAEGRLDVCARKPAPVQVQWGGFNTSALDGMDYFLADPQECPPDMAPYFTEEIYRLPDDYVVYTRPGDSELPEPGLLPARRHGHVTFGCFNNMAKVNPVIAERWAAILDRVPGSRLYLRGRPFDEDQGTARILGMLEAAGIPPERVVTAGYSAWYHVMVGYTDVDIALDPWPYSGGLTTIEAMWMGVPTLTLPGPTFVGRHAMTHLTTAGLSDWVVSDAQDYIDTAVAWAQDWDALEALRGRLREQLRTSPLCDGTRFAGHLEAALRAMHQRAAQGAAPA